MNSPLKSRAVLSDAHVGVFDLTETVIDEDHASEWRRKYFAAIGLLRAVGHVLRKVDCEQFPEIAEYVGEKYKSWMSNPEHAIFRHFIDSERNEVLKRYSFLVSPDDATSVPLVIQIEDGRQQVVESSEPFLLIEDGPFQDLTVDDLMWAAIEWWQEQLSDIEKRLSQ